MAGIQLSGLASGLDTEGMITQLMALERQPETRWGQQKQISATKEQALKDVLSRIKTLQTNANDLKSVTTWLPSQSIDVSDSSKINATAVSGAAPGNYTLTASQLACLLDGRRWRPLKGPVAAAWSALRDRRPLQLKVRETTIAEAVLRKTINVCDLEHEDGATPAVTTVSVTGAEYTRQLDLCADVRLRGTARRAL